MEEQNVFTCSECDGPVDFEDGVVYRTCDHNDAPILANMSAVVYGEGKAE
jgi:hypothetical protein